MNVRTVVEDGERLARLFAEWLKEAASTLPTKAFSLAVPGGSVAERFLPELQRSALATERLHVFWVDERAVSPDDPASNYGLAKRLWLDRVGLSPDRVHAMVPKARSLADVVRDSERELERVAGIPPRLDVALLGVGEDGHVASLFPGHSALLETGWVTLLNDAPKPPPRRFSMTLPVLLGARRVAIGAFGRAKARVIAEALSANSSALPLSRVVHGARECVLFLDHDAASEI